MEKRMLWAILNKSWRQHPIKQQLYGHLLPITKTIQVKRTRGTHKWHTPVEPFKWTSKGLDNQLEPTYNSSEQIHDIALKTSRKRWTIETGRERERERERVRDIRAGSKTWWWWWWWSSDQFDSFLVLLRRQSLSNGYCRDQIRDKADWISHKADTFIENYESVLSQLWVK